SVSRCLRDGVPPLTTLLTTLPTTVRPTIHAHRDRLVVELERGVAETGTQATDAPTTETLRNVREAIARGVSHGRRRTGSCGMVLSREFQCWQKATREHLPAPAPPRPLGRAAARQDPGG